jgi:hypothetical protein
MMLAAITKSPGWAITEDEGAKLSAAINNVTALYDVPMMDERGRALMALAMVGVEIYGTRVATAFIEANKSKAARRPTPTPIRETIPVSPFATAYPGAPPA